jgi:hypothetical protein
MGQRQGAGACDGRTSERSAADARVRADNSRRQETGEAGSEAPWHNTRRCQGYCPGHKDLKFGPLKETFDDARFSTDASDGVAPFMPQMGNREAAQVPEFNALQVAPETLAWIQLRGIGGEPLEVEAMGGPIGQELLDDAAAMHRGAIPNDAQPARHFAQQVFREGDHICRVEGVILTVEVQLALVRDGTDRRQMLTGPPLPQDRRLAHRGIGAHHAG